MSTPKTREDSKELLSLDEYLAGAHHTDQDHLFLISAIEGEPEKIRLTPVAEEGCHCSLSFTIDKRAIEGVAPYGHKECCGKRQPIAKVIFKKEASILLSDLFTQVQKSLRRQPVDRLLKHQIPYIKPITGPGTSVPTSGSGDGLDELQVCLNRATAKFNIAIKECRTDPNKINDPHCQTMAIQDWVEDINFCNNMW